MISLSQARLYGILDLGYLQPEQIESMANAMLAGGIDVIQLRAKGRQPDEIAALASRVLPLCRAAGVPFIINDHPEVAAQVAADGVHIGQDDQAVAEVRGLLGPDRIVGLSSHSLAQAQAAAREPVDYIGFGPLFATPTKPDYRPIGLSDIQTVHQRVSLPIFCIGGIKLANLPQIIAAGARRVVIVSGILQATDAAAYIREAQALLKTARNLDQLA